MAKTRFKGWRNKDYFLMGSWRITLQRGMCCQRMREITVAIFANNYHKVEDSCKFMFAR